MMTNFPFQIFNGQLTLDGGRLELPQTVVDAFVYRHLIVVRVEPSAGEIFNRNVFGVSHKGDVLWQIEESPHGTQEDKPYVNVSIGRDDELIAGNWNGVSYLVSPENGKITVASFDK